MFRHFFLLTFFFVSQSNLIASDHILVIWPMPAGSHFKSFQPLFEELVRQGHELTIVGGHKLNINLQKNYTHIDLRHKFKFLKIVFAEMRELTPVGNLIFCAEKIHDYAEAVFQEPQVQNLLRSNKTFDLVMGELFYQEPFLSFGYHFNAPVLGLCPHTIIYHDWMLANPFPLSYVPHVYLPMVESMSFVERFINAGHNFLTLLYMEFVAFPKYQRQMEKYIPFGPKPVPKVREVVRNISAVLFNTHYSFNSMRPLLPNIVPVAGLHLSPIKPLPEDLREFMNGGKKGVIYVCFGSLIEPEIAKDVGGTIVKLLASRQERVLFKWNPDLLSNIPSNFLVRTWTPQADVLNHPNCRLFITHGGLHGVLESINASVPLVGIPFFTDQQHNLVAVQYHKIGKLVRLENLETDLLPAVEEILYDPTDKYFKNAKKRTQLFNDRQSSPMDTAIFWVNHVLKHKNDTSHLIIQSRDMPWFAYLSLDVIATMIIMFLFLTYFVYRILIFCWFHLLRSPLLRVMGSSNAVAEFKKKNV